MAGIIFDISMILRSDYYYMSLLLLLTIVALAFSKHRRALLLSLIVVMLLTPYLKVFYQEDRPCTDLPTPVDCQPSKFFSNKFGFPSGHSVTSIILPAAVLGSYALFFFLPLAFFIAISRVYIGDHSLNQITAGISLGLLVFFLLDRMDEYMQTRKIRPLKIKAPAKNEFGRQIIHLLSGFAIIGILLFLGIYYAEIFLLACLFLGIIAINIKMLNKSLGPLDLIFVYFERKGASFIGRGALLYGVGAMLIISFIYLKDANFAMAMLAIFATGDSMSTIFGRKFGKSQLPWNRHKSFEGLLAFFFSASLVAFPFVGFMGLLFSAILAFVESLDIHIDDNILIPLVSVILFQLFG